MHGLIESGLLAAVLLLSVVLLFIGQRKESGMTKKQRIMLWRIFAATALLLVLQLLGAEAFAPLGAAGRWVRLALHLVDYWIIGHDILRKAFFGPVTPRVPASILQFHPDVTVICDRAAWGE